MTDGFDIKRDRLIFQSFEASGSNSAAISFVLRPLSNPGPGSRHTVTENRILPLSFKSNPQALMITNAKKPPITW